MEENNITTNRHAINAAIPVGVAVILVSILYYVFDVDGRGFWGYLLYGVLLLGIIWGIMQLRDKHRGGVLTYSQGLGAGTLISLYTGLITAVFTFVFYKYFAPEQIKVLLERAEEQMIERAPQLTDQELDMAMAMTEKMMTPLWMAFMTFFGFLIVGVILSLIVSAFLKRNESIQSFDEQSA